MRPLWPVLVSLLALSMSGRAAAPAGLLPIVLLDPNSSTDQPYSNMVLGAWEGGQWRQSKPITSRIPAKSQWRVQGLNGTTSLVTANQGATLGDGPCDEVGFLTFPKLPPSRGYRLATSPALNTRPRPVDVLPTSNTTYRQVIRDELLRRGVKNPVVNITSITRTDLDGNGTQEVMVAASHYKEPGAMPHIPPAHAGAGDYSLLLLRSVQSGKVKTEVIGESVFVRDEKSADDWQMPSLFDLAGIADLNGDGRMEIVATEAYYEGSGAAVYEWSAADGLQERLNAGCGA